MQAKESLLGKFDAVYDLDISPEILRNSSVTDEFIDGAAKGLEYLIAPLLEEQPLTHSALSKCERAILLENKFAGSKSLFLLGFVFENHVIVGRMHNRRSLEYRYKTKLRHLPPALHGYYKYFDGLDNPQKSMPGIDPYDLPKYLSSWIAIDQVRASLGMYKRTFQIEKDLDSSNLRVWIHNRDGRLFIVNLSVENDVIYYMNLNEPDRYDRLENVAGYIDEYCKKIILGY